jgi:ketopantoate reductase
MNKALMKIGFIGLGNVGGKLAGSLIRNGHDVTVRDLDDALVAEYVARGAKSAASPKELGEAVDLIVTCLPSPAASSAVAEGDDGFLPVMAKSFASARSWKHAAHCSWNAPCRAVAIALIQAISRSLQVARARRLRPSFLY